ncbi:sensor histidine kinase [Oceanidesulfovibrio marinus]|uniref:histidine kinase n=1 Tax=Oceanidesulfovibrio marinus TaxID=370038 RepID=A0ABX6NMI6_9BACT|nr:HAMP domain-containing sensor histidine kinase [Oceanidesulfovibrio marinus]QJT10835.1 HAMP domain-containing histidine kinase [Oceanidesulfovibrio marinus]
MQVWLLRALVFLLITLGASGISVMVYTHTVDRENMLQFRAMQRSEVLENVGRLLLEWRRSGAVEAIDAYIRDQQEHGRVYSLLDAESRVIAGVKPDQALRDLSKQSLQGGGYAFIDTENGFFKPPMRQPPMESFMFLGRDSRPYVLTLSMRPGLMPPPRVPKPLVFIIVGACVATVVLFLLLRISGTASRELRAAMRLLAQGDFGVRVDSSLERRNDPFSKLAKDFNTTVTSLAGKQAEQRFLITDLTHDMRSSLTRMALAMELARNTSPDRANQLLARIKADSEKLNAISEQLMEHVRLQWSYSRRIPLELDGMLRSLTEELNAEAREQEKRVVFSGRGECRVMGNESQLYSMVRNVAANGLRHTPARGEVRICLEHDAKAEAARITIQDQGPGLSPEMLREVFEPFKQAGENRGEAGLGLAIAKLVSERHGGAIELANRTGAGLQATITLPLLKTLEITPPESSSAEPRSEAAQTEGETVEPKLKASTSSVLTGV